ncbi:MAG: hypothetical protein IIY78_01325 [Clostridia bacterium]|nr:hypothetical protein [Clostridia bacterium]
MNKRAGEALNMFFSSFLIFAYGICSYYITQLSESIANDKAYTAVLFILVIVFGTLVFFATRVGNGKQVVRFSPSVLVLVVLPSLYILSAYFAVGLPLHEQIYDNSVVMYIACMSLGYGVPYTFLSGFEMVAAEDVYYPEHFENGNVPETKAETPKKAKPAKSKKAKKSKK